MPPQPSPLADRETRAARAPSFSASSAQLLLIATLASLTMLFGAALVGVGVTRAQNDLWRTAATPGLTLSLVSSSILLALLSAALEAAKRALARNASSRLVSWLTGAGLLALAFLASQGVGFRIMLDAHALAESKTLHPFSHNFLVGLHAAHVLGGLVPLGIVLVRARRGEYSSSRREGVRLLAQYWHYLGVVWLVLLIALWRLSG